MELENVNFNGFNVVIPVNNLDLMILFFSKNIENWVKERISKFILKERFHNYPQTKTPHNFISLIKMEWFTAFHRYINSENRLKNYIS